jgi:ComF family protein
VEEITGERGRDRDKMKSLIQSARSWWSAGLSFFYPEWCQLCGKGRAAPEEGFVCSACQDTASFIEPPFCERCGRPVEGEVTTRFECTNCRDLPRVFTWARSAVAAKGCVLEVIHRYKYKRAMWFEPLLARWLVEQAGPQLAGHDWSCIVPIPLHPVKQREREFNQAERLARRLSGATGIAMNSKLVRRTAATRSQTLLSREERQENMRNAFKLREGAKLGGGRVLLVDDVFTTGATAGACAEALLKGGASEVCVWTVARGV